MKNLLILLCLLWPVVASAQTVTRADLDFAAKRAKANPSTAQVVTTTQTVDASLGNVILVINGSANITMTFDVGKLTAGQFIYVTRYNTESTGLVTLQTSNNTVNFVQGPDKVFNLAWALPTLSTGQSQAIFFWTGSQLLFMGSAATITTPNDIEFTDPAKGTIYRAPNGNKYRITVTNGGGINTDLVP